MSTRRERKKVGIMTLQNKWRAKPRYASRGWLIEMRDKEDEGKIADVRR
jgi:hypothetical protein